MDSGCVPLGAQILWMLALGARILWILHDSGAWIAGACHSAHGYCGPGMSLNIVGAAWIAGVCHSAHGYCGPGMSLNIVGAAWIAGACQRTDIVGLECR